MSLARGDFVGAGLSLVSMAPYVGDALAKIAKGARLAKKIAGLQKKISNGIEAIQKLKSLQMSRLKNGTAKLRAKMKKNAKPVRLLQINLARKPRMLMVNGKKVKKEMVSGILILIVIEAKRH